MRGNVTRSAISQTMPTEPAETDTSAEPAGQSRYFNRELSWLAFNERVLAEARNESYPLLERLRFLSISGSNLDEFLMVRVAGLAGQVRQQIEEISIDGLTPTQQLAAIHDGVAKLGAAQQVAWCDLRKRLAQEGVGFVGDRKLAGEQSRWLRDYFEEHIGPIITPQAIDPAHPFPFVANQGMGLLFHLTRQSDKTKVVEMVLLPGGVPRFIRLPGTDALWISIEQLIARHTDIIFPGFRVEGSGLFRVLRDSDMEIEEDAEDLVRHFRSAIQRRRRGRVIMLELE